MARRTGSVSRGIQCRRIKAGFASSAGGCQNRSEWGPSMMPKIRTSSAKVGGVMLLQGLLWHRGERSLLAWCPCWGPPGSSAFAGAELAAQPPARFFPRRCPRGGGTPSSLAAPCPRPRRSAVGDGGSNLLPVSASSTVYSLVREITSWPVKGHPSSRFPGLRRSDASAMAASVRGVGMVSGSDSEFQDVIHVKIGQVTADYCLAIPRVDDRDRTGFLRVGDFHGYFYSRRTNGRRWRCR